MQMLHKFILYKNDSSGVEWEKNRNLLNGIMFELLCGVKKEKYLLAVRLTGLFLSTCQSSVLRR